MMIRFGKFRGQDIEDLPSDYLHWLAKDCDDEDIALAADEEYQFREKNNRHIWE